MHRTRSTLALLVGFLALSAYVYFVELERRPASETPPNEQLFDWESDVITGLTLRGGGDQTELSRADDTDGWQITAPVEAAADDTQVSSITTALTSLEVPRVIADEATDLAPFGLAEPAVEVAVVVTEEHEEHRLLIGDTTPTGGERYAKLAASDRVFLVASHLDGTFGKSTFELRDKTILDFESGDVEEFQIESRNGSLRFTKDQNEWHVAEPWQVRGDFSTIEGTVGRLSSGEMRSIIVEAPDASESDDPLAMYGLSEPSVTATVRLGSASATLLVGDSTADGTYYAKDASRLVIFTIDSSLVDDLERESGEYRDKDLFDFRPFNATRVEIERMDDTMVFEKSDADSDAAWTRVDSGSTPVDRTKMDDLLAELSGLRAETFVDSRDDDALDPDTLVATIRVRFGTTTTEDDATTEEQVTLWRSGERTYGVHGDEPGAAVIDTESVDDAFEALETLVTKGS